MAAPLQRSAAIVALLCLSILPPCLSLGQTLLYEFVPELFGLSGSSEVMFALGMAIRIGFWLLSLVGAVAAAVGVAGHRLAVPLRAVAAGWVVFRTISLGLGIAYTVGRMSGAPMASSGDVLVLARAGTSALVALSELGLLGLVTAWLVGGRPMWMIASAVSCAVLLGLSSLFWTTVSVVDALGRFAGQATMDGWIGTLYTSELVTWGNAGFDLCLGFTYAMLLSGAVAMWPRDDGAGAGGAR